MDKLVIVSNRKMQIILGVVSVLVLLWLALGIYLQGQVKQSRAKVAQSRIEEARRQEFLRRGAQYKQDLEQRAMPSRVRNAFDGR